MFEDSALDRCRDPGAAGQPGRESPRRPGPARQLPSRVPARLGLEDVLHPAPARPILPASADEFLQALLGDDPSLAPLKPLLIARTQGNPFFLEESIRTLVETGVLVGERGAYRLAKPAENLQVPATVQAVLAARIDRLLPEEKRLLQTAAVIGTEVSWPCCRPLPTVRRGAAPRPAPAGR